jgi:hypothetical protein
MLLSIEALANEERFSSLREIASKITAARFDAYLAELAEKGIIKEEQETRDQFAQARKILAENGMTETITDYEIYFGILQPLFTYQVERSL